ncbi:hypothetical protein Cob_v008987 [Colletotrichum orbiculare MAFF 240422]|uniref:Uncharacterized protein n=1 Tax=Colletotrichum orbiculare (strain 104-T / ATCC 96160 / CBS 514.97 / LARS 414 / MAFF 240422) TaxID=1213857 RepID=A0A484FKW2_COLOR|nr:hypothetical protein Cob_v008987 [Colletotrichum orbiculare MAFF 240422]
MRLVGLRGPPTEAAMEESHLFSRGWCVQERALSRLVLYPSRDALFWECNELCAGGNSPGKNMRFVPRPKTHGIPYTESWRNVIGDWDLLGAELRNLVRDHDTPDKRLSASDVELVLGPAWMGLIERYSACQFTNYSDRLVALPSVTEKLSLMTGANNVAGQWREALWAQSFLDGPFANQNKGRSKQRSKPSVLELVIRRTGQDIWLDPGEADGKSDLHHVLRVTGTFC